MTYRSGSDSCWTKHLHPRRSLSWNMNHLVFWSPALKNYPLWLFHGHLSSFWCETQSSPAKPYLFIADLKVSENNECKNFYTYLAAAIGKASNINSSFSFISCLKKTPDLESRETKCIRCCSCFAIMEALPLESLYFWCLGVSAGQEEVGCLNQAGFRMEKLTWSGKNVFFAECCGFEEEPSQYWTQVMNGYSVAL